MKGTYLGPEFSNNEFIGFLNKINAPFHTQGDSELFNILAGELDKGHIVEIGSHHWLSQQDGVYANLYKSWIGNTQSV